MLKKIETRVMDYVYWRCDGKKSVLLTPKEILTNLAPKFEITVKELELILRNLSLDDYLEVESGDKNGMKVYIVALRSKGIAYPREKQQIRAARVNSITWKVILTVGGSILAFIVARLLNWLPSF
jgi:hypothetical protein